MMNVTTYIKQSQTKISAPLTRIKFLTVSKLNSNFYLKINNFPIFFSLSRRFGWTPYYKICRQLASFDRINKSRPWLLSSLPDNFHIHSNIPKMDKIDHRYLKLLLFNVEFHHCLSTNDIISEFWQLSFKTGFGKKKIISMFYASNCLFS